MEYLFITFGLSLIFGLTLLAVHYGKFDSKYDWIDSIKKTCIGLGFVFLALTAIILLAYGIDLLTSGVTQC